MLARVGRKEAGWAWSGGAGRGVAWANRTGFVASEGGVDELRCVWGTQGGEYVRPVEVRVSGVGGGLWEGVGWVSGTLRRVWAHAGFYSIACRSMGGLRRLIGRV